MIKALLRSELPDDEYLAIFFWPKIVRTNNCWLWAGAFGEGGYGFWQYRLSGSSVRYAVVPHRVSYVVCVDDIPNDLSLDHLCRVRSCVRPEHLDPVTIKINILRGDGPAAINSRKTECKNGHPLDVGNIYLGDKWKEGERPCWTCRRAWWRKAAAVQWAKKAKL